MTEKINYIMIAPHFPKNFETFAPRLKEAGINVLGIADANYDELSDTLKSSLTEYYKVNDMENYEEMYKAVAFFAHKYGKISRIESHNEHWLELDAKLRTDFNVFGLKDEDMDRIKTKSKMKEVFKKARIPVAKGRTFTDEADARVLAEELGFPVIVKPDNGVGASDTYQLKTKAELEHFLSERNKAVVYIMEEFIDGDMVTFDGLVDRDGNIVFYSSIVHNVAVLSVINDKDDMFYYIPREISEDLKKIGERCVKAFGIKERFFHFEFFRTKPKGKLMAIEINARPPGGATIDMFNYANDIDIFKEYASLVKENKFNAQLTRPYNCVYIANSQDKDYVNSEAAIRSKYGDKIADVLSIPGIFSAILGNKGYIFKTPSIEEMFEMIDFVRTTK